MTYVDALCDEWLAGQPCANPACDGTTDDGQRCPACGTAPAVTRHELRAEWAQHPLEAAEEFALHAIRKGIEMLDQALEQIHEADRIRVTAVLALKRDRAQALLNEHSKAHNKLAAEHQPATRRAERAELEARDAMKAAQDDYDAIGAAKTAAEEEGRFGLAVEAGHELRLKAAEPILKRYQDAHAAAAAELEKARQPVRESAEVRRQLERLQEKAVADLENPGRIGYGAESLALGLQRHLKSGRLTGEEVLFAAPYALDALQESGLLDMVKAQVRADVLAEREQAVRGKPLLRQRTADGQIAAVANPYNPSSPQPWHPASPGPPGGVVTPAPAVPATPQGFGS